MNEFLAYDRRLNELEKTINLPPDAVVWRLTRLNARLGKLAKQLGLSGRDALPTVLPSLLVPTPLDLQRQLVAAAVGRTSVFKCSRRGNTFIFEITIPDAE